MKKTNNTLEITNEMKGNPIENGLPFSDIARDVLGDTYNVSLVFIGDERSHELNKEWRKKDKPTNVLSFPLSDSEGEVFINLDAVRREYASSEISELHYIGYLFVHALHHLKGLEHGSKMETEEQKICVKYGIQKPGR